MKDVHLKTGKDGKGLVGDAKGIVKTTGNEEMSRKNNLVPFVDFKK